MSKNRIAIFSDLHYAPEKPINNGSKIDIMPKISEKFEQLGGVEKYIEKYQKAEIQYFPRESHIHKVDFEPAIKKLCSMYKMKEITIHPPLGNYDIEAVILYDKKIVEEQLKKCIKWSKKYNVKINLLYHTHWQMTYHDDLTINKIKNLIKFIEGENVTLLLENLFLLNESPNECTALSLVKKINHPNLKMCFDICHMYCQANMYDVSIENWLENKLNREDMEKYVYQVHFSYTANNDGYKDKVATHGVGHPTEELLLIDWNFIKKYGMDKKQIVTEISEKNYSNRISQIQDIKWLEKI